MYASMYLIKDNVILFTEAAVHMFEISINMSCFENCFTDFSKKDNNET